MNHTNNEIWYAEQRDLAIEERDAAVARAEAAEAERDELKNRIGHLDEQVKIQCSDGNWNYDPYMHGMANGLLVAQATMHDLHDFTGLSAPDKWLDNRENARTAALREREADLLHALHMEQDAHDRLREELAAREWRPVTEPPDDGTTVEAIVRLRYRVPYPLRDDEPTWNVEDLTDDYCIEPGDIRGWRSDTDR